MTSTVLLPLTKCLMLALSIHTERESRDDRSKALNLKGFFLHKWLAIGKRGKGIERINKMSIRMEKKLLLLEVKICYYYIIEEMYVFQFGICFFERSQTSTNISSFTRVCFSFFSLWKCRGYLIVECNPISDEKCRKCLPIIPLLSYNSSTKVSDTLDCLHQIEIIGIFRILLFPIEPQMSLISRRKCIWISI